VTSFEQQQLLARTSPAGLAVATSNRRWLLARHLDVIDQAIVDAVAGRGPQRLVVAVPPRHGKSELISHRAPAWYLGCFPDRQVMLASYEASFAETWGRKGRDLLEEYGRQLYGVTVRADARAQDRWYTSQGGVMAASGIGGRFTGMGADLLIIDDPVKNAEEARSQVIRSKHWDWWQSTAVTRLHPGAVVIVLMTRWHEEDLGGMLLAQGHEDGGEPFHEIRMPAIAEADDALGRKPGEALWPERYPIELLEQRKRSVGTYWWSAMYQGRPAPEGGGMFRRDWFSPLLDVLPAGPEHRIRWVRYWDFAATEAATGTDPDWSVGLKLGRRPDGTYIVADVRRVRATPKGVESLVRHTAETDGRDVQVWIEQEPGSSGKIVIDYYQRTVLPAYAVRGRRESGSKIVRADPVSAHAEARNIQVLKATWNEEFFAELEQFPQGAHDDQVDATSGAYAVLARDGETRSVAYKPSSEPPVIRRGDLTLIGDRYKDKE
jgi:predicted phage terminase large subunit-like protein